MDDIYDITNILSKLTDLHKLYYLEKDQKNYNICDENNNSIIYNNTYNILQSCKVLEKQTFTCAQVDADTINHYTYDDFMKDDGILYHNKYLLCHSNFKLKSEIENVIKLLYLDKEGDKIYGNGYRNIIEMLFTIVRNPNTKEIEQIITRDNFNIVNICIFMNEFMLFLDYMNAPIDDNLNYADNKILNSINEELYIKIDKKYKSRENEDVIELFNYMLRETKLSINIILSYLYKKNVKKYRNNINNIKTVVLLYKINKLFKILPYYSNNNKYMYISNLPNIINLTEFINGYKFCEIASRLNNYNKSLVATYKSPEEKYKNVKKHLDILNDVVLKTTNINFERNFFYDMIIIKYNIENNIYKIEKNILNKIFGQYYYFIINKTNRLFPFSIKSTLTNYNNMSSIDISKLDVEEYKKYRESKPVLKIIDTLYFNTKINNINTAVPGCGESCVYNYFNELLYDGNIINIKNFPEEYKDTNIYKFYNNNYNEDIENIELQNKKIGDKNIFTDFSYVIFNIPNIKYARKDDQMRDVEIVPSTENIYKIIINVLNIEEKLLEESILLEEKQKSSNNNYLEKLKLLTEQLCIKFNKNTKNISINNNQFIFNNLKILPTIGHCTATSLVKSNEKSFPISYNNYYIMFYNSQNLRNNNYKYNDILTLKLTINEELFKQYILPYINNNYFLDYRFLKEIIVPIIKNASDDFLGIPNFIISGISDFIYKIKVEDLQKWSLNNPYLYIIYIINLFRLRSRNRNENNKMDINTISKIFKSIKYKFLNSFFNIISNNYNIKILLFMCNYTFSNKIYDEYYGRYDQLDLDTNLKELLTKYKYYNYLFKRSNDLLELSKIDTNLENFSEFYKRYYFLYTLTAEQLCTDIKTYFCDNFNYFKSLVITLFYKEKLDRILINYSRNTIDTALNLFYIKYNNSIEDIINLSNNYTLFIIFLNLNYNNVQLLKNILEYYNTNKEKFLIKNIEDKKYITFDFFKYEIIINKYIEGNMTHNFIKYPNNITIYYINNIEVNKSDFIQYINEHKTSLDDDRLIVDVDVDVDVQIV